MGINQKKKHLKFLPKTSHFLDIQSHWGHKKEKTDSSSYSHSLGVKNNFCIMNPENVIEFNNRVYEFCFHVALSGGTIYFFNSSNDNDEHLKKLIMFFGFRSLHPTSNHWVIGSLTNKLLNSKTFSILILPCINKNAFILKEASQKLIPVISIKDNNVTQDKVFHPFLSNDDSKEVYYYFYNNLSNIILKAHLLKHSKTLQYSK